MPQGIITKIGYRICDWNGNTIIEPLPHPHDSTWQINGMQQGAQGSQAIGNFTIPLYSPKSIEYAAYRGLYKLIKHGQRVEGYVLEETGEYKLGVPCFSGIITKVNKELDKFEIVGFDTLWMAQQSQFYPGMLYSGTGGTAIDLFNDTENLVAADDFGGNKFTAINGGTLTWSNVLGAAWTLTTDDEGLNGYKLSNPALGTENVFINNLPSGTNLNQNLFNIAGLALNDSLVISAWFHIAGINLANGNASGAELVLSAESGGNNLFLARAECASTGSSYNVTAEIWIKSAGVYTQLISTSVFTGLTGDFRCQVTAIVTGGGGTLRVLVNGKDTNCVVQNLFAQQNWFGNGFGARVAAGGTTTPAFIFFSRFYMKRRSQVGINAPTVGNWVQAGQPFTDTGGPAGVVQMNNLNLSGISLIDLWGIAASAEGYVWRKDVYRLVPSTVFTDVGDPISWGLQGTLNTNIFGPGQGKAGTGLDLSNQVILDENTNIVSGGALANAESLGTELKLGFTPGNSSGGQVVWPDVAGMLTLGQGPLPMSTTFAPPLIFSDVIGASVVADNNAARRLASQAGANKALSNAGAKKFTVLRTPELAGVRLDTFDPTKYDSDANGIPFKALSPQVFREQDFVTLNVPSLDIFMQKVSVLSYIFKESDPFFDVILDQFTFHDKELTGRRASSNNDGLFLAFTPR